MIAAIKHLEFHVEGKEILRDLNFSINKAEIIGFLGPNGAGKSSTIKILTGLIRNYKGNIELFGNDHKAAIELIKLKIGYVPDELLLYDCLSPLEFIALVGSLYGLTKQFLTAQIEYYFSFFNIHNYQHQKIVTLSKGMKQKILIVSGLIHNPELIFLDEPLNGLDIESIIKFKELMYAMKKQGKTVFFSTHITDILEKIADRIIIINNGQIIAEKAIAEIHTRHDNIEDFYINNIKKRQ